MKSGARVFETLATIIAGAKPPVGAQAVHIILVDFSQCGVTAAIRLDGAAAYRARGLIRVQVFRVREQNRLAQKAKETWQAEKSRQTRERIIASTASVIREGGFSAASSKRIADRSSMTWGAAQHHFGSKEQIFDAVILLSHERFTARFADIEVEQRPLKNRVCDFIDRM